MDIQKDIFPEIINKLQGINEAIVKMKKELLEKDKRITELENKNSDNN
jgi:hypothetical protein